MLLSLWVVGALMLAAPVFSKGGSSPSEQLDAARALANAGFRLYEQGDYATAIERFQAAERIYHALPHLLYSARAHVKLGKLVEAVALYEQVVGEQLAADVPEAFRTAQKTAQEELDPLRERIPSIELTLEGTSIEEARVLVDGAALPDEALAAPINLNPGEHRIVLQAAGYEPSETTITLEEGAEVQAVTLSVGTALPEDDAGYSGATGGSGEGTDGADESPSIVPPLVVLGVGVAGLGVGAITGIMTLNDASELKDNCPQNPCPPENQSLIDSVNTLGTVSTVGFIVGGAAVAAGALWLLLQPSDEGQSEEVAAGPELEVMVGAGALGVRGTF